MERLIKNYDYDILNERDELFVSKISDKFDFSEDFFNKPFQVNFYIIIYITNGTYVHRVNDLDLTINKGEVILICPLQNHTFSFPKNIEGSIIAFTEKYLVSLMEFTQNPNKFELLHNFNASSIAKLTENTKNSVEHLISLLENELKNTSSNFHEDIIHPLLITLMFNIYRDIDEYYNSISQQREKNLVAKFKILILENLNHSYSVNYYAEKLNTSVRTLQNATKTAYDKTPKEMINEYLIITSNLLLSGRDIQIKEIAYRLGFTDSATFSKFYKKHTSLSPLEFKRNLKQ